MTSCRRSPSWAPSSRVRARCGQAMPRNALTLTLDVLAELASNALGAYNRARVEGCSTCRLRRLRCRGRRWPLRPGCAVKRHIAPGAAPVLLLWLYSPSISRGAQSVIREPALTLRRAVAPQALRSATRAPVALWTRREWSQADRRCDRPRRGVLCHALGPAPRRHAARLRPQRPLRGVAVILSADQRLRPRGYLLAVPRGHAHERPRAHGRRCLAFDVANALRRRRP